MLDVGVKVTDNTVSTMLEVRNNLNADVPGRAVEILSQAAKIEFYGVGACGLVAEDVRQKFFRLGISASAFIDPQLQALSATLLKPGDVAVVISK